MPAERFGGCRMTLSEQTQQIGLLLRELIHLTLCGRFVWPPPKQLGAMAETIAGNMIVADFDDEHGLSGCQMFSLP